MRGGAQGNGVGIAATMPAVFEEDMGVIESKVQPAAPLQARADAKKISLPICNILTWIRRSSIAVSLMIRFPFISNAFQMVGVRTRRMLLQQGLPELDESTPTFQRCYHIRASLLLP